MATSFPTVKTTNPCNYNKALSLGQSSDCPLHTNFQKIKNFTFLKAASCIYYFEIVIQLSPSFEVKMTEIFYK